MVFPLFLIALLWDRFDCGESRLLRGKRLTFGLLGRQVRVHTTALASGLILIAMGVFTVVVAFRGASMPTDGWQVELSARLQHWAHLVQSGAGVLPSWLIGTALAFALLALAALALRQVGVRLPRRSARTTTRLVSRKEEAT